ncbi:MAG TPA: Ig-like domain-containing protein, partial [Longimicrobiales bacterium]|nr:Ig-like domain-containing protein [Longimicrobiales bacterium]
MAVALITACSEDPGRIDREVPAALVLAPVSSSLLVGDTVSVHATAIDARGQPLENVRFVWETADSTVAIVDTSGLIYGRSEGTTTASALVGEIRGDVSVV